jgi:lytic murein transglycosylase
MHRPTGKGKRGQGAGITPRPGAVGLCTALLTALMLVLSVLPCRAGDAAFRAFIEGVWPEAQAAGISRQAFDAATRDLEPDYSLPDLALPGRPPKPQGQAEFVQTPAQYLSDAIIAGQAEEGRALLARHRATLDSIERRFGVPGTVVLAIWGRETGYGKAALRYNALRVAATQAFVGRRKDDFRRELLIALKLIADGDVTAAMMKSSWAGAMGQTQMLPSQFKQYAVDFDGDGRRDIWNSVPDALASAANQLAGLGWRRGRHWAYEVRVPASLDCTAGDPDAPMPVAAWLRRGVTPIGDVRPAAADRDEDASLLLPAGPYGPAFLILRNYYVLKDYNFSDLYVLFVGHLADRIAGGGKFVTPWGNVSQPSAAALANMQRQLAARGLYDDKIDGKAGMKTRLALGRYQAAERLAVDCWPSAAVLDRLDRAGAPGGVR